MFMMGPHCMLMYEVQFAREHCQAVKKLLSRGFQKILGRA